MDPQERLFLEVAYASLEDAGYKPAKLCDSRKVGVFAGVMNGNYPTGSNYSSIANRISYLFDFQGPSMAVDTACSSSLTAIHLALESLYSGMSECAIAGGVNLIVAPLHYLKLSAMAMLSPGNKNKTFADQADGFVDGEGVGAIVLKLLPKATADGDHIYGIIKGSMLNAGGKTNGYTVPNPQAQARLISDALRQARVHARTISYLETHGTGTALGDPIEITGLTKAFRQYTEDKQFCAIGSVKSNIGHCEGAAGIAGVTKILLQLQHRQLVPSLHAQVTNPEIDFNNSPFKVQQELAEWKPPLVTIDGETREYPRRAGISSFGAGGANAHLVIEEYVPPDRGPSPITVTPQRPVIIVLSAKNEERLREQARNLLAEVAGQDQSLPDTRLVNMAYTLQVGREAMEKRLAVIAASGKELHQKLEDFLKGRVNIENLYQGQVKRSGETPAVFAADEDMAKTIDAWIAKRKYAKLLELWVNGLDFDWNKLYGDIKPGRISLPTYPFARERYWVTESKAKSAVDSAAAASTTAAVLHPLLHQNTADLLEQRFSSTFTGQEFFLADHGVKGQRVLPAVASLEMARAAVLKAAGALAEDGTGIRLKNVVWTRPIVVGNQPVQVHIRLFPTDGSNLEIAYEIYGEPEADGAGPVVYSQGNAVLYPAAEAAGAAESPLLDLTALQARCSRNSLPANQCYETFKAMGIDYGPGHRGLERVYVGIDQVLAKLSLPDPVSHTRDQFVLHPSLMDSALQASIGLTMKAGDITVSGKKPALPFALGELEIHGNCTPAMWALIRYSSGSEPGNKIQKLDIDLCDDHGTICVRMKGFSSRIPEDSGNPVENSMINDEIAQGDDEFYQSLLEKISNGELSEHQFKHLIINLKKEGKNG
jgi:acyl transferase domain-containing protein